ncbi:MAG: gamma carbonic anhydrase family protein [Alphaproteobacteria bacterium]|nr:gamma carbonic anhydrase family protein [Alphaproteobacteria bacterium]
MSPPLILPFHGILPKIHPTAFIAPGAVIIGDVEIGEDSSIWFGCVIRGDVNKIRIGARTNIQDGTVIHVAGAEESTLASTPPAQGSAALIGDDVTVGHMALLHACTVESHSFVGMKAVVMDGATIKSGGMLAAGALLTAGKTVASGEIWAGNPAKFWRKLTEADSAQFNARAGQYAQLAREYRKENKI